jgi:signal transduction histidine kinase
MMNSKLAIQKPLVIVLVGILIAFGIFIFSVQESTTNLLNAGFHIFLAFLSGICVAVVWVRNSLSPESTHLRMDLPLSFAVLVHTRGFIVNLFSVIPIENDTIPYLAVFRILEVFLMSILFLIAALDYNKDKNRTHLLHSKTVAFSIITIAYFIYAFATIFLLLVISRNILYFLALSLFLLTICCAIVAFAKWNETENNLKIWDSNGIPAGAFLVCLSTIPALVSVLEPSSIWFYSTTLLVAAIYIIALSIFIPQLREIGVNRKLASIITQALLMIILIPFIITLIAGAWSTAFEVVSPEAYTIIHGGAAFLSGLMAMMIYSSRKEKIDWSTALLVIVFLSWCVIEANLAMFAVINYSVGGTHPLLPYLLGSAVSVVIITQLLSWESKSNIERPVKHTPLVFASSAIAIWIFVWTGEFVQNNLVNAGFVQFGSPLITTFQLTLSIVLIIEFTGLFFLYLNKNKGQITADQLALGFLALWIVPIILKGLFLDWTLGWWAAEIVLLSGLLVGPSLIGVQYMQAVNDVKTAYVRSSLYADILMHDMSNCHQGIRLSVESLDNTEVSQEFRAVLTQDALYGLDRASELIWNVRLLNKLENSDNASYVKEDLLVAVKDGIIEAERITKYSGVALEIENSLENHIVYADEYLPKVFMHLVRNAIQYSRGTPEVIVKVKPIVQENNLYFRVFIIDSGSGINNETRERLLHRYSGSVFGTGLGLSVVYELTKLYGGTIEIQNRNPMDYTKGSIFVITLPSVFAIKHNSSKIGIRGSTEKERMKKLC